MMKGINYLGSFALSVYSIILCIAATKRSVLKWEQKVIQTSRELEGSNSFSSINSLTNLQIS